MYNCTLLVRIPKMKSTRCVEMYFIISFLGTSIGHYAIILLDEQKTHLFNVAMEEDIDDEDDILPGESVEECIDIQEESTLQYVGSIFDDDMIDKYVDKDGKARWCCKWCDNLFAGWNATKAVRHVNKLLKTDIKPCRVRIDADHANKYKVMLKDTERKRKRSKQTNDAIDRSITSHNNVTASTLDTHSSMASSISSKRSKVSTAADSATITSPSKYNVADDL